MILCERAGGAAAFYIGRSKNLKRRWKEHLECLNGSRHPNAHMQAAWDKYGASAFSFEILQECQVDKLISVEQAWLDAFAGDHQCMNMALDASSPNLGRNMPRGWKQSEETKRKIGNKSAAWYAANEHPRALRLVAVDTFAGARHTFASRREAERRGHRAYYIGLSVKTGQPDPMGFVWSLAAAPKGAPEVVTTHSAL